MARLGPLVLLIVVVVLSLLWLLGGGLSGGETEDAAGDPDVSHRELGPRGELPPEPDPMIREWNVPYHRTRAALRARQEAAGRAAGRPARPLKEHTFYTLDCTHHSLWQVMTLEMTWEEVGSHRRGFLSRVVSGCKGQQQHKQPDLTRHVLKSPEAQQHFGTFFAPKFETLPTGEYYAPYNRPNGIWHWLNHSDLTEDVFILLDPDMIYLRPLAGAKLVR